MDRAEYLRHLREDAGIISRLARGGLDTNEQLRAATMPPALERAVASCPGWKVSDLVGHLGEVVRWAGDVVANAREERPGRPEAAGERAGAELVDWFDEGVEALLEILSGAPGDLSCWSFLPAASPVLFWARRQAQEVAVHRVDVELSLGARSPIEAGFAADGIDELLCGFAQTRPVDREASLLVAPDDQSEGFLVRLFAGAIEVSPERTGRVDARLGGSAENVLLYLWNRPGEVVVEGDATVVEAFRDAVRI